MIPVKSTERTRILPVYPVKVGKKIHVDGLAAGTHVIIAGTKNAITRAGKVLPPTSFKSHTRFATEYHGCELYGQKVFEPDALAVAYITLG